MPNWVKFCWHDPVLSKVIAGVIIGSCTGVALYLSGLLDTIYSALKVFFQINVDVKLWIICAIILALCTFIVLMAVNFFKNKTKKDEAWKQICQAQFGDDFIIRWKNFDYEMPGDIRIFCKSCDLELEIESDLFEQHINCFCRGCGFSREISGTNADFFSYLNKLIKRQHRELVNNSVTQK